MAYADLPSSVPVAYQGQVDRLRAFLRDTAALNILEQEEESTDLELYMYLQDALEEINIEFLPVTSWTLATIPSWNLLKLGATVGGVLTSHGISSARNTLTYRDSGGVTVQDYDKFGRYINYYNILINKYMRGVANLKLKNNIDNCYGGVSSEYYYNENEYYI